MITFLTIAVVILIVDNLNAYRKLSIHQEAMQLLAQELADQRKLIENIREGQ